MYADISYLLVGAILSFAVGQTKQQGNSRNWPPLGFRGPPGQNRPPGSIRWYPGPLGRGRNAQQASVFSNLALNEILSNLRNGDLNGVPIKVLRQIPAKDLASLPPEVVAGLPPEIHLILKEDADRKSFILFQVLQSVSVDRYPGLPWNRIARGLPAEAWNALPARKLGSIPWDEVLPMLPPDVIRGMEARTLSHVSGSAWRSVSSQQLAAVNPYALASLPVNKLKNIPAARWKELNCDTLMTFSMEVLSAVNEGLIEQLETQCIYEDYDDEYEYY